MDPPPGHDPAPGSPGSAPAATDPPPPTEPSTDFIPGGPDDPAAPWYVRHRMRALLLTALIPVVVGVIAFLTVWLTIQTGLKNHVVYAEALSTVRSSTAVRAELGETIEPGFLTTGQTDENAGTAEMMFSVRGGQASAGVRVFARLRDAPPGAGGGHWEVTFLDVGIKTDAGREKVITLVEDERPQRFADDAQDH